jgi:hypothetical protein
MSSWRPVAADAGGELKDDAEVVGQFAVGEAETGGGVGLFEGNGAMPRLRVSPWA